MIVSHRWRYIFIKTRKTGGTSLEIALSALCGAEDVITPITAADEALRAQVGGLPPQHCVIPEARRTFRQRLWTACGGRPPEFYNHMPADEARRAIDPAVWSGYFKFAFERNPYDKIVSAYYWRFPQEPRPSLGEFIASRRARRYRNAPLYQTEGGELLVDHVGRYEDLAGEVEAIRARLGMPPLPALPRAKGGFRTDRRRAAEVLSADDRARVAALYRDEIERFGYRCE